MTTSIARIESSQRMSQAVVHGGLVYLAGQVDLGRAADVGAQTRAILERIDKLLASANSDKTRILTASVWLADIGTFAEMNAAWDQWVAPNAAPARATVEARLADPGFKVEIAVIAAADGA